jgi:hypothetical protein
MNTQEGTTITDGEQLWLPVIAHVTNNVTTFTAAISGNAITGLANGDTHQNKPTNYPDL